MKKILFTLTLLFLFNFIGFCQISKDTILTNGNYIFFDDITILIEYNKKSGHYNIMLDTLCIFKSLKLPNDLKSYCYSNKKLYLNTNYKVIIFNFNNNPCTINEIEANDDENLNYVDNEHVYFSGNNYIRKYNIKTGLSKKYETQLDFLYPFIKTNSYLSLIGASMQEAGDIYIDSLTFFDENLEKTIQYELSDEFKKYILEFYWRYNPVYSYNQKYAIWGKYIINSEYKISGNCLPFSYDLKGVVINNNKLSEVLLLTRTDKNISVVIPFYLNVEYLNLMYRIYNEEKITISDLKNFDKVDLRILKNLILAKYNYKFEDEFLQAYFNLYDFYSHHEPRVTEVESKFTDVDKYNLSILESVGKVYGLYPEASQKNLTKEYLQKFNNSELKIMRNEIFARHGYIFRQGGEMDKYFKLQPWYKPLYPNVDKYFSDIEKYNISLILSIEKSRN